MNSGLIYFLEIWMKNLVLMATILLSFSVFASPVNCFKEAKKINNVYDIEAAILCSGATSLEPVNCFKEAKRISDIYDEEAAILCSVKGAGFAIINDD